MGGRAEDRKAFWCFVAEQADHDDPRGDFVRDTRATLEEGEDPDVPLRSACHTALHEYREAAARVAGSDSHSLGLVRRSALPAVH